VRGAGAGSGTACYPAPSPRTRLVVKCVAILRGNTPHDHPQRRHTHARRRANKIVVRADIGISGRI